MKLFTNYFHHRPRAPLSAHDEIARDLEGLDAAVLDELRTLNAPATKDLCGAWHTTDVESAEFDPATGRFTVCANGVRAAILTPDPSSATQVAAMSLLEAVHLRTLELNATAVLFFSSQSWSFEVRAEHIVSLDHLED